MAPSVLTYGPIDINLLMVGNSLQNGGGMIMRHGLLLGLAIVWTGCAATSTGEGLRTKAPVAVLDTTAGGKNRGARA